jgi:cytosine/adenosine deaminase-related metal-dependent hydrolase
VVLDGADVDFEGLPAARRLGVALFSGNSNRVRDVYVGGRAVVEDRRHGAEDEAQSAFRGALKRLRAAP